MQETQETQVPSLSQEDTLEEEMATDSSILVWEFYIIPVITNDKTEAEL